MNTKNVIMFLCIALLLPAQQQALSLPISGGNIFCIHTDYCSQPEKKITIVKRGTGSGVITSSPSGINCGSVCEYSFNTSGSIKLSGIANYDSNFEGFSESEEGELKQCNDGTPCLELTIVPNSDQTWYAHFSKPSSEGPSTAKLERCIPSSSMATPCYQLASFNSQGVSYYRYLPYSWHSLKLKTWVAIKYRDQIYFKDGSAFRLYQGGAFPYSSGGMYDAFGHGHAIGIDISQYPGAEVYVAVAPSETYLSKPGYVERILTVGNQDPFGISPDQDPNIDSQFNSPQQSESIPCGSETIRITYPSGPCSSRGKSHAKWENCDIYNLSYPYDSEEELKLIQATYNKFRFFECLASESSGSSQHSHRITAGQALNEWLNLRIDNEGSIGGAGAINPGDISDSSSTSGSGTSSGGTSGNACGTSGSPRCFWIGTWRLANNSVNVTRTYNADGTMTIQSSILGGTVTGRWLLHEGTNTGTYASIIEDLPQDMIIYSACPASNSGDVNESCGVTLTNVGGRDALFVSNTVPYLKQ